MSGVPIWDNNDGTLTKKLVADERSTVLDLLVSNANASLRFFQLFDKATAPIAGDVPLYSYPVPGGTAAQPAIVILDSSFLTTYFAHGLGWAWSTTVGTFTDSATAADHLSRVHYR